MKEEKFVCQNCKHEYIRNNSNTWFDEKGFGYSTKLTKCPQCGKIMILNYLEDYGFSRLNNDQRYYW